MEEIGIIKKEKPLEEAAPILRPVSALRSQLDTVLLLTAKLQGRIVRGICGLSQIEIQISSLPLSFPSLPFFLSLSISSWDCGEWQEKAAWNLGIDTRDSQTHLTIETRN